MTSPSSPDPDQLKAELKKQAAFLGFDACGVSAAEPLRAEADRLHEWLRLGHHGSMSWMDRNVDKRTDPTRLVPGARSVISVLHNYYVDRKRPDDPEIAKISRYAWGDDYHVVLKEKLGQLLDWLDERAGGVSGRPFVDSAPVMDKVWAQRSGLGWIGKHSNLISREFGSWFFIGELMVDLELPVDDPMADFCGSCTRCLDACPTQAIRPAYVVDATRCISYLTIESRAESFPPDLEARLDGWVFGCDVCQDVCPWNRFRRPTAETRYHPRAGTVDTPLSSWASLTQDEFSARFRLSPVKRTKHGGFQRNVRAARGSGAPAPPPEAPPSTGSGSTRPDGE